MVKTAETEVFENNPDPKRRFDDLARKELGREPSENVSSQDILATQLRRLDGPYFHHRAVVAAAPEAEEYGVDVVFSDLKSAVDKTDVAQKFAGAAAITARIQEIAGGSPTLRLTHGRLDAPQQFDVDVKDAIKIVVDGNSVAHGAISTPNKPGIKVFRKEISSLFSTDP
jgi:DNA-binding HxlR family transcriptional regulator